MNLLPWRTVETNKRKIDLIFCYYLFQHFWVLKKHVKRFFTFWPKFCTIILFHNWMNLSEKLQALFIYWFCLWLICPRSFVKCLKISEKCHFHRDHCNEQFNDSSTIFWNLTCTKIEDYCAHAGEVAYEKYNNSFCKDPNSDDPIYFNGTGLIPLNNVTFRKSASEEFWYIDVLGLGVDFTINGTKINQDLRYFFLQ